MKNYVVPKPSDVQPSPTTPPSWSFPTTVSTTTEYFRPPAEDNSGSSTFAPIIGGGSTGGSGGSSGGSQQFDCDKEQYYPHPDDCQRVGQIALNYWQ